MYHKHHTKGIIIGTKVEGSDSKRAEIFTESFGFINARVQGGRNLHSKLRSGSQSFSMGEFSLVHGKTGWRVVSARAEKNLFELFKNSPEKLKIVCNVLNLIKKLVGEEGSQGYLFGIVEKLFNFLDEAKESEVALAECLTLVRILHALGYMRSDPELAIPISSSEIQSSDLEALAPRRSKLVALINESLKAA
jgi:DNA repair protein RecO